MFQILIKQKHHASCAEIVDVCEKMLIAIHSFALTRDRNEIENFCGAEAAFDCAAGNNCNVVNVISYNIVYAC